MFDLVLGLIPGGGITALFGALVAALVGAVGFYLKGSSAGAQKERDKQTRATLDAVRRKKEIDDEVDALAPADLDTRFDRWRVPDDAAKR